MAAVSVTQPAPVRAHIDHIVVGIRSLDEGIAAFDRLTGVTAVRGGQHPTRGTENALASLGPGRYLELIAPGNGVEATPDLEELRALAEPTIIGWAVSVSDMGAARRAMSTAAVILDTEEPGSRVLPSGTTLQWSTATLSSPEITMAPFLIRWNPSTQHPSTTSPSGCSLSGLEVHDPAAADLSRALNALRVSGVTIRRGEPEIAVSLSCPRGRVRLQSR